MSPEAADAAASVFQNFDYVAGYRAAVIEIERLETLLAASRERAAALPPTDTERLEALYWFIMEDENMEAKLRKEATMRLGEHYIDAARSFVDAEIIGAFRRAAAPQQEERTP